MAPDAYPQRRMTRTIGISATAIAILALFVTAGITVARAFPPPPGGRIVRARSINEIRADIAKINADIAKIKADHPAIQNNIPLLARTIGQLRVFLEDPTVAGTPAAAEALRRQAESQALLEELQLTLTKLERLKRAMRELEAELLWHDAQAAANPIDLAKLLTRILVNYGDTQWAQHVRHSEKGRIFEEKVFPTVKEANEARAKAKIMRETDAENKLKRILQGIPNPPKLQKAAADAKQKKDEQEAHSRFRIASHEAYPPLKNKLLRDLSGELPHTDGGRKAVALLAELKPDFEQRAAERLRTYYSLLTRSREAWLLQLIKDYPRTQAAKQARVLLP